MRNFKSKNNAEFYLNIFASVTCDIWYPFVGIQVDVNLIVLLLNKVVIIMYKLLHRGNPRVRNVSMYWQDSESF